jgi:DNA (cytosine-5)-methyltransferase 1
MKDDRVGAWKDTSWPVKSGLSVAQPPQEKLEAPRSLRFVDLFAGLGGFHLALQDLGHRCVFASEIHPGLRALYKENFGMEAYGDIRQVDVADIPEHDILCAGFPCQPFSKSGKQNGLDDPRWGDLFSYMLRVLRHHKPRYLMLENVPNLERHRKGTTWKTILELLDAAGYEVEPKKLSPHRYGIPQVRERLFIVGDRKELDGFEFPPETNEKTSIRTVLDEKPPNAKGLSEQALACIKVWQNFLDRFPGRTLPSFPIWTMEFGATYPYEDTTPFVLGAKGLRGYLGSHGTPLTDLDEKSVFAALPSYARTKQERFPEWKIRFIKQNREFYDHHKGWIDKWMPQLMRFPASWQKFEWNCKNEPKDLRQMVLQFRASGLRAKRPDTAPSLIAMTTTQVPIITWEDRYITPEECAKLQSMKGIKLPDTPTQAYTALGNAVNVHLVGRVARALLERQPIAPKLDLLHETREDEDLDDAAALEESRAQMPVALT